MSLWDRDEFNKLMEQIRRRQASGGAATVDAGQTPPPKSDPFGGGDGGQLPGFLTGGASAESGGNNWADPAIQMLMEQQRYERGLLDQDREQWRTLYGQGAQAVADAGGVANTSDVNWMNWLNGEHANLGELEMPSYQGGYESAAGSAAADPLSIMGQYDAANRLRMLSDPSMTDAERSMMEISRRKQERDQRASRTAALSSLRGRGFASGGDEIAALLGSQQETGERRMLEDLGARGQAVERSMGALKGYGDITSKIRDQSFGEAESRGKSLDATSEFNISTRQDFDTFMAELQQKELQNKAQRSGDLFDRGRGVTSDIYTRGIAPAAFQLDAFGSRPGGGSAGGQSTTNFVDLLKAKYGAEQADKAAKAAGEEPEDDGLLGLGLNIGPIKL